MAHSARTADPAAAASAVEAAAGAPGSQPPDSVTVPPPALAPPDPAVPPPVPNDVGEGTLGAIVQSPPPLPPLDAIFDAADEEDASWSIWLHAPSWLMSTVVHLLIVILLALVTTTRNAPEDISPLTVSTEGDTGEGPAVDSPSELTELAGNLETRQALSPGDLSELPEAAALSDAIGPISAKLGSNDLGPKLAGGGKGEASGLEAGEGEGSGLELRLDGASRASALRSGGGTPQSEKAVAMALAWLALHQNYDGSWSFAHNSSPKCHGKCRDDGQNASKVAATAMALLPFLGTGQTHREGEYRRNIDQGLKFLVRTMQSQRDGSMWDPSGTMYGHGLASIVLCEAYGMTHDQTLRAPAQSAINFIVFAQDPVGGGWRYQPQMPGDTSVVGWQLMALKSAQMAYLRVPPATIRKTGYFLDFVQDERGAVYGYQRPENKRPATSAIGLLCRMYMGWKEDHEPLKHGVQILGQLGPSTDKTRMKNNMYYNYYATQVMHHFGGYPWQRWNTVMREYLIETQATQGHEAGSWFLDGSDDGARPGGRLYCTALAAMTLEVYYRYMPLYRPQILQTKD